MEELLIMCGDQSNQELAVLTSSRAVHDFRLRWLSEFEV